MKFEIAPKSTETILTWNDAKLYCFSLTIDGKTGWRLPTKYELNQVYESENDFEPTWYWSSTVIDMHIWNQNFEDGFQYNGFNDYITTISVYVRAIRDLNT